MAGEKRSAIESDELVRQESVILLDVEGTTTSISFVKDTLFPYVREFLKKHVDEKWETEEFKADFAKLKEQAKEDEENKVEGFVPIKEDTVEEAKETLIKNVLWQMDNDRKAGALKALQGHMWQAAHKPIKGHVYDDVPKAFEEWTKNGKKLYIYSSGSVLAQKLLYGDTVKGNLLEYISGHFDTAVGAKQEAKSYKNILDEIKVEPSNVLFLTDIPKEAEAAKATGLSAIIVVREGNAELSDEDKAAFKTIESFAELHFQSSSKRPKLDEKNSVAEKKDPLSEEKPSATAEPASEPMDTSEDAKVTESEKSVENNVDVKSEESKVEKAAEKPAEKVANGPAAMEEDAKSEEKNTVDKVAKETTDSAEKAETLVSEEKSKTEVPADKKTEEPEKKSEETVKAAEVPEEKKVEESVTEEKATKEVSEKITEKAVDVKENGDAKAEESKLEGENKENIKKTDDKKAEPEVEVAEEAKEVESTEVDKVKETEDAKKSETEAHPKEAEKLNGTTNGDALKDVAEKKAHSNGVSEESAKENGAVEEDSMKVKKPLADGAGESDVVSPPVVAATS